nr:right-handed parallel beta-helix repeat-containing protein [Bacteroidota bacterium]
MLHKKLITTMIMALFATLGTLNAQEKYAVLIAGNMNPGLSIPATEQWNGGYGAGQYGFDEFWNDTYLMWEMLIKEDGGKGYSVDNVNVLYGENGNDFTFPLQDERYQAAYNNKPYVVDEDSKKQTINDRFTALANIITADDFLFVWIMSHGGTDANGSYFYSYDNQKVYDSELATWLGGIAAHKKTVFLSLPNSGGFIPELEGTGNIVITAGGATEGASRADDIAPNGTFIENEVLTSITYNHGEVNYHLFSSLTGFTPFGEDQYSGTYLSTVDVDSDGFVDLNETWDWTSNTETISGEIPVCSDLGNIKNTTEFEYPTLIHEDILYGVNLSCRGLVGISKDLILGNGRSLQFLENSKVFFVNNLITLWAQTGSVIDIGDNVNISSDKPMSAIWSHTEYVSFGDHVTFINENINNIFHVQFQNQNINLEINNLYTTNCQTMFMLNTIILNYSEFTTSQVAFMSNLAIASNCDFNTSRLYSSGCNNFRVTNCDFTREVILPNGAIYEEVGIDILYTPQYIVENCTITGYNFAGIQIQMSGLGFNSDQIIIDNTISNITNQNSDGAGIFLYFSNATIEGQNNIFNNNYGIRSLNNSEISITGIRAANYVSETQQIHDNDINQIYATYGA